MTDTIEPTTPMTRAQAKRVTEAIRTTASDLWELLRAAHEGRAWAALGYETWTVYVETEFAMTRRNANRLVAQGEIIQAIAAADPNLQTGRARPAVASVSARQAAQITKTPSALPAITAAVKAGVPPTTAVRDVLSKTAEPTGGGRDVEVEAAARKLLSMGRRRMVSLQRVQLSQLVAEASAALQMKQAR